MKSITRVFGLPLLCPHHIKYLFDEIEKEIYSQNGWTPTLFTIKFHAYINIYYN